MGDSRIRAQSRAKDDVCSPRSEAFLACVTLWPLAGDLSSNEDREKESILILVRT